MKKWSLIFLLWYIFVDNTPWIQDPEKKTVWILKPGWSTYEDCWDVKTKLFELLDGNNKKYLCVDMHGDDVLLRPLNLQPLFNYLLDTLRKKEK